MSDQLHCPWCQREVASYMTHLSDCPIVSNGNPEMIANGAIMEAMRLSQDA